MNTKSMSLMNSSTRIQTVLKLLNIYPFIRVKRVELKKASFRFQCTLCNCSRNAINSGHIIRHLNSCQHLINEKKANGQKNLTKTKPKNIKEESEDDIIVIDDNQSEVDYTTVEQLKKEIEKLKVDKRLVEIERDMMRNEIRKHLMPTSQLNTNKELNNIMEKYDQLVKVLSEHKDIIEKLKNENQELLSKSNESVNKTKDSYEKILNDYTNYFKDLTKVIRKRINLKSNYFSDEKATNEDGIEKLKSISVELYEIINKLIDKNNHQEQEIFNLKSQNVDSNLETKQIGKVEQKESQEPVANKGRLFSFKFF